MMTREYLANYVYLEQIIADKEKKIKQYRDKEPRIEYGKVYGSSHDWPYTARGFTISGFNIADDEKRRNAIRQLVIESMEKKKQYEEMKLEIEQFILGIENLSTSLMFSYRYIDGLKEEDIAKKLNVERSTVSKRISKYLEKNELSHNSQNKNAIIVP